MAILMRGLLLLGLILVSAVTFSQEQSQDRINVDVYYESLCGDSVDFVVNQLYPAFLKYKSSLAVTLIPYGKASQTQTPNGWSFTCQHGPNECYGNRVMACAIQQLAGQPITLDFVRCYMETRNNGPKCAQILRLDYQPIQTCAESDEGANLLAGYGDRTAALTPKLSFVPTIVVGGVYSEENQNLALNNFEALVCKYVQCETTQTIYTL